MPIPARLLLCTLALAACGTAAGAPRAQPAAPAQPAAAAQAPAPPAQSTAPEVRSVRTSLRDTDCTTISVDEEAGGSIQTCPGTAGYTLMALDGDARMSINVRTPAGREHELGFWSLIGAFSTLGDEAEWRVRGDTPIALIVPLTAFENPDVPNEKTSYLMVARVGADSSCVVHRLPAPTRSDDLHPLADAAPTTPCLSPE